MCKINPRVDFAFKKLFGSEENKDLLISLINAIVSQQDQVVELELKNPYNLADYQAGKMSILDIKAKAENGQWFNVEMQIGEDRNFDKRAIYYWAKLVTEQLGEGMIYKELNKTISINILDYDLVPDTTEVHSCYKIINIATGKNHGLHDVFELHYIELKKFTKTYHEIQSALDRWSSFLTTAHQLDREHTPKELASDKNIVKAIAAIDRMFNEEERKVYEVRLQEFTDVASIIASGAEKNIAKGVEIGMEIGMEKGVEIGMEKGVEIGMEKGVEIGMEKGAVIGRVGGVVEGQSKLLKRLLERRFGTLPQWATEKLSSASEHELESWGDSILSAPTLEAVFNQI